MEFIYLSWIVIGIIAIVKFVLKKNKNINN